MKPATDGNQAEHIGKQGEKEQDHESRRSHEMNIQFYLALSTSLRRHFSALRLGLTSRSQNAAEMDCRGEHLRFWVKTSGVLGGDRSHAIRIRQSNDWVALSRGDG